MKSRIANWTLTLALAAGLAVLIAAAGAYWWFGRTPALGPLASEALILPGDAYVIAGLDVARITSGANYKKYLPGGLGAASSALHEFERQTGVELGRDVSQVFFAGRKQADRDTGVALFLGRFDAARIGAALEGDPRHKPTTRIVEGVTLYLHDGPGPGAAIAVASSSLALLGSPELVEAMLTNRARGTQPVAANKALSATLRGLPAAPAFWVVGDEDLVARLPKPPIKIPMPRTLVLTGEVDPNVLLRLTGEMADETESRNLAQTLTGLKAMAALMAGDKPELLAAAQGLSVAAEGRRVVLVLQLSPEMLARLVDAADQRRTPAN